MQERFVPATDWREEVGREEDRQLAACARALAESLRRRSPAPGAVDVLQGCQLAAAQGTLEVLDGTPLFARQGIFARPAHYETWVRLSAGGVGQLHDPRFEGRSLSMRVFGVSGLGALSGVASSQDFVLGHAERPAFPTVLEFAAYVAASRQGRAEALRHLARIYGAGTPGVMLRLARLGAHRSRAFATETFHSVSPMANGPWAVRMRLLPAGSNGRSSAASRNDASADFAARLRRGPLHWDVQLQFFASADRTPIEDCTVRWPTPFSTVARLMLPQQDITGDHGRALAEAVQQSLLDPWLGLAQHRPLGQVQRLRRLLLASRSGIDRIAA
jgi:hypothetical protein